MLHTIKKLSVFAIVAIVAMAFSACSSDEEQPAVLQQLLGKWQPVTRSYTEASTNTNTYEISTLKTTLFGFAAPTVRGTTSLSLNTSLK